MNPNWSQLKTVLWLRWRLMSSQLSHRGKLNAILTVVFAIIGLTVAVGGFFGGIIVGAWPLRTAPPLVLMLVWDGLVGMFIFFWLLGIVREIQRAESLDIRKLLHLPVSLRQIFLVNYIASHFTFDLLLFMPGMLGLSLGLMWSKGGSMFWLIPLTLSFFFMMTAWTYYLRGWLVAIMANPRRRRAIIVGATAAILLLSQLPNLFSILSRHGRQGSAERGFTSRRSRKTTRKSLEEQLALSNTFISAHTYVPPLWVGGGASALASQDTWPAVAGSLSAILVGSLGLMQAYRSTRRFYFGEQGGVKPPSEETRSTVEKSPAPATSRGMKNFLEKDLPMFPAEATPLWLAFFRGLTRAPEVKMSLATNVIMVVVFSALFLSKTWAIPGERLKPFVASASVALSSFGLIQLMFNQFGFERNGFRMLVLLPTQRKYFLLAKNFTLFPIVLGIGMIFLGLLKILLSLGTLTFLASCLQLLEVFLLLSMVGNFASIMVPYRISAGSLKPTKVSAKTSFFIFFSQLFSPIALSPIVISPALGFLFDYLGWLPAGVVNLLSSLVLAVLSAFLYWFSLDWLGRLLQWREKEILEAVVTEVE
jgi:ABC-2 type transport system permease protein